MGNNGETIAGAFWEGFLHALGSFWDAVLVNPWLLVMLIAIVAGSLYLQLAPRRRRRRRAR
jgi:hypothetical protein